MALIELRNVSMRYENQLAVEHVSGVIESGDYIVILGENGSGKSTLLKGIAGLRALSSGKIVFGEGLKQTEVGYLSQQLGRVKEFPASVMEVVLSGCLPHLSLRPFFSRKDRARALDSMYKLGIDDIKNKAFAELSGGQQQRVLLARALSATAKLLLLDEPMSGLDPMTSSELYRQIRTLNRDHNVAIVMVSHDVGSALKDATKVLCMHQGMAFFGTVSEFYRTHYHKELMGGDHCHV